MARIDRVLLCSCEDSMTVDAGGAAAALDGAEVVTVRALCTDEVERAAKAFSQDGTTLVACGQMVRLFEDLFEEVEAPGELAFADIRDRAGWTADGEAPAKQAALLAEAALERPATPVRDVQSEGTCLVLGDAAALQAADRLADRLAVTVLLAETPEELTPTDRFDIALGRLGKAQGAIGGFEVVVDGYAPMRPGGRGAAGFAPARDGAKSGCDIILDLRGQAPLFPAPEKRDGYLRADPGDPVAVERAAAAAADLQGTFEKPLYIRFEASLCAHARASQTGCTRCLDICPTGAILPDGDAVVIDPMVCAGCGACAAVCPSGAASYDDPNVGFLFNRLRTLVQAYRTAGGGVPRALFHDADHGAEMIRLSARFGRGLPADLIPVEVPNVEGVGHAEMLAAVGVGFAEVSVLIGPHSDRTAPDRELALARAILAGAGADADALRLIDPADPDGLEDLAYGPARPALVADPILPLGGRREVTRLAASALGGDAPTLPLPPGAPYGAVAVDTDACTLCLACVSLCPVGALGDNPDKPQLRFQEAACLQCGICETACPETAITLTPQLNLGTEALSHRVLHEEEPFECIECGKPFGVKSTIEAIVAKLEGKHWMYTGSDNTKLIQMCDGCRVNAQYHQQNSPFFAGERPRVRTTEDYLNERKKPN
ncbi:MAG: 4Fe-4S binding protein [Rhodobacter sp.]|nr:4Fe-4S binding protein [Rhodobacter sp.]